MNGNKLSNDRHQPRYRDVGRESWMSDEVSALLRWGGTEIGCGGFMTRGMWLKVTPQPNTRSGSVANDGLVVSHDSPPRKKSLVSTVGSIGM